MVSFRPYRSEDFAYCAEIFRRNIPRYFHPDEMEDFTAYLQDYAIGNYWVCLIDNAVIGCGGVRVARNVGRLVYGMLDPAYHGRGFGRVMLDFRLKQLAGHSDVLSVKLDTSPEAMGFFFKSGFVEESRIKDGLGPGIDEIHMTLVLH